MTTLIHKRRSDLPTGTVTTDDGIVLGRVERQTRLAKGTSSSPFAWRTGDGRGVRLSFWAAIPAMPWGSGGASLGTRYVTRAQATAALRDFAQAGLGIAEWQQVRRDGPEATCPMNVGLEDRADFKALFPQAA